MVEEREKPECLFYWLLPVSLRFGCGHISQPKSQLLLVSLPPGPAATGFCGPASALLALSNLGR